MRSEAVGRRPLHVLKKLVQWESGGGVITRNQAATSRPSYSAAMDGRRSV